MTGIYQERSELSNRPLRLVSPLVAVNLLFSLSWLLPATCMPALIPVDNTLGALFIATVLSSMCVSSQAICNALSQDLIQLKKYLWCYVVASLLLL